MTHEQFEREKDYQVALMIAKALLSSGLINEQEYRRIKELLIEKYRPIIGGLCL